jgi:molecular chaperone DnaJ
LGTDHAYAELGLRPGASEAQVKSAWRRLASQWHPDRNPSAAAIDRMQRINQAIEQIRRSGFATADPSADASDTPAAPSAAGQDPSPDEAGDTDTAGAADGTDAADDPPRTVCRKVRLTLEEAAAGCVKPVRGRLIDRCKGCAGVGYRVTGSACATCAGAGTVRQRTWYGWFGTPSECAECQGSGIARQGCESCKGHGKLPPQAYRMNVRIPHGVRSGDVLQVDGRRPRAGQPALHLELHVEVLPHPLFKLDPDGNVHCEVPVDGFAWIANRTIDVPTLDGLHKLQLQRDQLICRLAGQGFPIGRRGPRGDLVVTLQPVFPECLSADQDILLDQLIATSSGPGSTQVAQRLAQWRQALREWEQARAGRSG